MLSHMSERFSFSFCLVGWGFFGWFLFWVCVCFFLFIGISQFLSNHRRPFSQGWCMQGFLCKHPSAHCSIFFTLVPAEMPPKNLMRQQLDCYGKTFPREPWEEYEVCVIPFICCMLQAASANFCISINLCTMRNSPKQGRGLQLRICLNLWRIIVPKHQSFACSFSLCWYST